METLYGRTGTGFMQETHTFKEASNKTVKAPPNSGEFNGLLKAPYRYNKDMCCVGTLHNVNRHRFHAENSSLQMYDLIRGTLPP